MMEQRQDQLANHRVFVSCVVPVYNEDKNIDLFLFTLGGFLKEITNNYEIIFIDDGSSDYSALKIKEHIKTDHHLKLLRFSRNFGKEKAISCGLKYASGDVCVIMDADLQHPVAVIKTFLEKWATGYDMVYAYRQNRQDEGFIKKHFTKLFYRITNLISDVKMPEDASDFRLLDKGVVAALNNLPESNRFMKGLYAWVGFKSVGVPYEVQKRHDGQSSFKFWKLLDLATTGITSFSNLPLKIWSYIGVVISFFAFIYGLCIILGTLFFGKDTPGYATIVVSIMFFGGIQLISIGILGEYIARIFTEVKGRPHYIISEKIGF